MTVTLIRVAPARDRSPRRRSLAWVWAGLLALDFGTRVRPKAAGGEMADGEVEAELVQGFGGAAVAGGAGLVVQVGVGGGQQLVRACAGPGRRASRWSGVVRHVPARADDLGGGSERSRGPGRPRRRVSDRAQLVRRHRPHSGAAVAELLDQDIRAGRIRGRVGDDGLDQPGRLGPGAVRRRGRRSRRPGPYRSALAPVRRPGRGWRPGLNARVSFLSAARSEIPRASDSDRDVASRARSWARSRSRA